MEWQKTPKPPYNVNSV